MTTTAAVRAGYVPAEARVRARGGRLTRGLGLILALAVLVVAAALSIAIGTNAIPLPVPRITIAPRTCRYLMTK